MKRFTPKRAGLAALLIISLFISSLPNPAATGQQPVEEGLRAISGYRDYDNITQELVRLAEERPMLVHLESLGTTWEGRNIWAVKLSDNVERDEDEPEVLIMGGHHGNELPAVEIPMDFIEFMVTNYGKNLTVTRLLDTREIWVIPMVNPDGHEYSLEGHDWRKNRRPIDLDGDGAVEGVGVDINRNYGYRWGEEADLDATSHDPASRIYCGPAPFSENENVAVRELVDSHNFTVSMSFHTYGQIIYYPWGNEEDPNGPRQETLAAIAGEMGELSGYTPMEGRDAYPTTGDSDDWLFANKSCYPFTIEMGTEYIAPPDQLDSMFQRVLPAMTYAIDVAEEPERAKLPDWTVMTYMSGDNSLSAQVSSDLNEMTAGLRFQTARINVLALADTDGTGDTKLYRLEYAENSSAMVPQDDGAAVIPADGEADLSRPSTLSAFINWSTENYPAQRYALVLWGHGGDLFTGIGPDKGAWLGLNDMEEGLEWPGIHMTVLGFDACYMGSLEIYETLSPHSDFIVSSQVEEQENGWNYTALVKRISEHPETNGIALAGYLVDSYAAYYSGRGDVAMAAVDTHMLLRSFMPSFEAWSALMEYRLYPEYPVITRIRNASVPYYGNMIDLDTMLLLTNMTSDASKEVRSAAASLLTQRERIYVREFHSQLYNINGMGIYFPDGEEDPTYSALSSSRWTRFVSEYDEPVAYPLISGELRPEEQPSPFPATISLSVTPEGENTTMQAIYTQNSPFLSTETVWKEEEMEYTNGEYRGKIPDEGERFSPEMWYYIRMESGGTEFVFPWNASVPVRAEDSPDSRFISISMAYTADLGISGIDMPDEGVIDVPFPVNITIENRGGIPVNCSLSLLINYSADGEEDGGSREMTVPAYGSLTATFFITPQHEGNMSIRASLDLKSAVLDPNPDNNTALVKLTVDGDMDRDGIGDAHDADRDGDGYSNDMEVEEGTDPDDPASRPPDNDNDGIPDDMDTDDDNDGVPDSEDAYPMNPNAHYNPVPMLALALLLVIALLVMLILRHRRVI